MGTIGKSLSDPSRMENFCSKEPTRKCPVCGEPVHAEWVDIGFGPYSQQAGPFHCENCDWVEDCPHVNPDTCHMCFSRDTCFRPKEIPE